MASGWVVSGTSGEDFCILDDRNSDAEGDHLLTRPRQQLDSASNEEGRLATVRRHEPRRSAERSNVRVNLVSAGFD